MIHVLKISKKLKKSFKEKLHYHILLKRKIYYLIKYKHNLKKNNKALLLIFVITILPH